MKKVNIYIGTILIGFSLLVLSGCKDFLDINEDPNNPTEVPLNQILPTVQIDVAGSVGMSAGGLSNFTSMYIHQTVQRGQANNDYGFTGSNFGVTTPWRIALCWYSADPESLYIHSISRYLWRCAIFRSQYGR